MVHQKFILTLEAALPPLKKWADNIRILLYCPQAAMLLCS
jgi:hypothetical protein